VLAGKPADARWKLGFYRNVGTNTFLLNVVLDKQNQKVKGIYRLLGSRQKGRNSFQLCPEQQRLQTSPNSRDVS